MKNRASTLSDELLATELRDLVQKERESLTEILGHLKEVDSRKLYLQEGYPSLFEYVVKELGYSESAAFRRISAMRLLKSLPASEVKEVESALQSGSLNLSKVTMAQQYFKGARDAGKVITQATRKEVLEELENKSTRECERYFAKIAPEMLPREKIREVAEDQTEVRLIVNRQWLEKLKKLKNLQSHVKHDATLAEVLEFALDIAIAKKDPTLKKSRNGPKTVAMDLQKAPQSERFIASSVKSFIWKRDGGKCTYRSDRGRVCGSTYQLQIDHIHPVAFQGDADPKNLRLLCRAHNLERARRVFGSQEQRMKKADNG